MPGSSPGLERPPSFHLSLATPRQPGTYEMGHVKDPSKGRGHDVSMKGTDFEELCVCCWGWGGFLG